MAPQESNNRERGRNMVEDFWLKCEFNKEKAKRLNPDIIPDRPPGSIPVGLKEWPNEEKLEEMKREAFQKEISRLMKTPCQEAVGEYYRCFFNGLEQHNPNVHRDCLDNRLELLFCEQDYKQDSRKQKLQRMEQMLGPEKAAEIKKMSESFHSRGMSEEAMARMKEIEENQRQVRREFEARKARNKKAQTESFVIESVEEKEATKKKPWWRFGF